MALQSKKKLIAALAEIDPSIKAPCYEAFGRKVFAFAYCASIENRRRVEDALEVKGFQVHRSYHPGSPNIEVRVSYFKAWHWDE